MPEGRRPRGVTPHPGSGAASETARLRRCRNGERRYPVSEVTIGGREELPHTPTPEARGGGREEQPRPEARGGDERSYHASEVRGGGREEIPHAPSPRPRAAAGRSNLTTKEPRLRGRRRA